MVHLILSKVVADRYMDLFWIFLKIEIYLFYLLYLMAI